MCGRTDGELKFPLDDVVSRQHCRFTITGNDIFVEDLSSTNRTRVNSVPITPSRPRRIKLNDVIEFGTQRFILTNQSKFAPSNTEDDFKAVKLYKAMRGDDGILSSNMPAELTKRTAVLLDRITFQKLKLKETFFNKKPREQKTSLIVIKSPNEVSWFKWGFFFLLSVILFSGGLLAALIYLKIDPFSLFSSLKL